MENFIEKKLQEIFSSLLQATEVDTVEELLNKELDCYYLAQYELIVPIALEANIYLTEEQNKLWDFCLDTEI